MGSHGTGEDRGSRGEPFRQAVHGRAGLWNHRPRRLCFTQLQILIGEMLFGEGCMAQGRGLWAMGLLAASVSLNACVTPGQLSPDEGRAFETSLAYIGGRPAV